MKGLSAGDGYSSRAGDSILNGCIPVVIMDNVDAAFESILDWNLFSVRINEVCPFQEYRENGLLGFSELL